MNADDSPIGSTSQYNSLINNTDNASYFNNNTGTSHNKKRNVSVIRPHPSTRTIGKAIKTLKTYQSFKSIATENKSNKWRMKINVLNDLESIYDNISLLTSYFFQAYPNQTRVNDFLNKYNFWLKGTYLDVLLVTKEFKEFNIFNYWTFSSTYHPKMTTKELYEKKEMISLRNNIILSLLVVAREMENWERSGEVDFQQSSPIFSDLRFLNPMLEKFKNLIIETDNNFNISYEVELFFFAILGFKDKSRIIKQKLNQYFKDFIKEINWNTVNFDTFLNVTLEKNSFDHYTNEEWVLYRKIINNACLRNFYVGVEYLLHDWDYCWIMSEGRIWKNIGIKMDHYKVYNLWLWYEDKWYDIRDTDSRETWILEYDAKIKKLHSKWKTFKSNIWDKKIGDEYNKVIYEKNSYLKEIYLYTVSCLSELLVIFFRYELKELALFFFEEYKIKDAKIPLEWYEICMDYDEDISIDIIDMAVNSTNVKKWYIEIAMLKKYFRLARSLLKFPVCQKCWNSTPPDSQDYFAYISKIKVMQKQKWFEKIKFQKENNDMKIVHFIQEKDTVDDIDEANVGRSPSETVLEAIKKEIMTVELKKQSTYDPNVQNQGQMTLIENIHSRNSKSIFKDKFHYSSNNVVKTKKFEFSNTNIIKPHDMDKSNLDNSNNINDDKSDNRFLPSDKRDNWLWWLNNNSRKSKGNDEDEEHNNSSATNLPNHNPRHNREMEEKMKLDDNINNLNRTSTNSDATLPNVNCTKVEKESNKPSGPVNPFAINVGKRRRSVWFENNPFPNESAWKPNTGENENWSHWMPNSGRCAANNFRHAGVVNRENSITNSYMHSNSRVSYTNKENNKPNQHWVKANSELFELNQVKQGKMPMNIQMLLIDHLRDGVYFFDVMCLWSTINIRYWNPDYFEKICAFLLVYSNNEDAITKCPQPWVSLALSAEFLIKIGNANPKIKYKAQSVATELWSWAENIQTSMKDEDMLNYYLREQCDHNNRSALEIYAENRFYNWLNDWNVGSIVRKWWYGSGHEQSIYSFFRWARILTSDILREHYDPMTQLNYLPKNSVYTFQFYQFIKNCSVRNFFESASVIGITILYQFIIYWYVTFTKEDVTHPSDHFYFKLQIITDILMYLSLINYVFLLIYFYKTGRKLKPNVFELVLNVIMLFSVTMNILNVPELLFPVEDNHDWNIWADGVVYSVILTIGWMKVILILMTTNSYGPFIRIMFDVIWHVFAFLIIFFAITFLFAQCFTVFFRKVNSNFLEIYDGFLSLFDTAFGQVYFQNFEELDVFGYIALMAYTTISNIMLFNLIVAIINNLFNNWEDKADAENRAVLVLKYERIKWDDRYGLLILLPAPFNAVTLFFIPWLFLVKDNLLIELNILFSKICYFLIAVLQFIFLWVLGVVVYPFTLGKSLCHSTYNYWQSRIPGRFTQIIVSFWTRPFTLLWYLITDLYLFWSWLYQEQDEKDSNTEFEYENLRKYILALRKVWNDARFKEKKKMLPIYEWYSKLSIFKKKKRINRYLTQQSKPRNGTENSNPNGTNYSNSPWEGSFNNTNAANSNFMNLNFIRAHNSNDNNDNDNNHDNQLHNKANSKEHSDNSTIKTEQKVFTFNFGNENCELENNNNNYVTWYEAAKKNKKNIQEEMKLNFRRIIDKIVDPEGLIDIERTLLILPDQVKYNHNFMQSWKYLSMRVFIRGLTKYFFNNNISNPIYSFKKLQLLVFKLVIKFNMIYNFFDEQVLEKINEEFKIINESEHFEKTPEALQKYEEKDDVSEYDDEGEFVRENMMKTKKKEWDKDGASSAGTTTNKDGESDFSGGESVS